jgi:poly(A) polymerase
MVYSEGVNMEKSLAIQSEVMRILGTDQVFLCGGAVRDLVMGNTPKDYDFCTPMMPDEMEIRVAAAGRKVYAIGKKFGTIGFKCPYPEKMQHSWRPVSSEGVEGELMFERDRYEYVEVTTFRSEVYTSKSRNPEVQFVPSLDEDLARRDFTMNAMVLRGDGKIYDPYGGKLDIYSKLIKTVGMPKDRIREDPLRMLRAARFAARYNFTIDPNFIGKARQLANRIFDVSVERWVQELDKIITSDHYAAGIEALDKMGLIERIMPELRGEFWSIPYSPTTLDPDQAWRSILQKLDVNPKTANYMAGGICHRLKFSNDRTKIVLDK